MKMFRKLLIPAISSVSLGVGVLAGSAFGRNNNSGRTVCGKTLESYIPFPVVRASSLVPSTNSTYVQSTGANEIMRFGFPSFDNVRNYDDFILAYDRRNKTAYWVFEHLTADKLNFSSDTDRSKFDFKPDESIHSKFRSSNSDYKGSGYDRGHLAAARNHRHSQRALDHTFHLTNVAPQVGPGFNRGIWNSLEKYVRAKARKSRNTYVCTGPLYLPRREADGKMYVKYEVIGKNHVSVPTHFFKVVVMETNSGEYEMLSYMLPNQPLKEDAKLSQFLVPVDAIERAAGFLIFEKLPRERLKLINRQKVR